MQLLPGPCSGVPETAVVVVVGELLNEAARKLLMKKTRAITIIINSRMRDLLLVALTARLLRGSSLYSFLCVANMIFNLLWLLFSGCLRTKIPCAGS
jgi:hypothetical protein